MSDILDDLKMLADHCDQENGDEPCDLGMLLIRAIGEIRKLRSQPVSAAEVPFPIPDKTLYGPDRTVSGHFYTAAKVRTYGDAREAAGYAAGVTSGAKQMFDYIQFAAANTSDTEWDTQLCELSQDALEAVSPVAHAEWKTIQRAASESRTAGEAAGYARGLAEAGKDAEPAAYLYTLEYGKTVANTKVSVQQLNYPFGVCGADYLARNDDGVSYVRQTKLYTDAAMRGEGKP